MFFRGCDVTLNASLTILLKKKTTYMIFHKTHTRAVWSLSLILPLLTSLMLIGKLQAAELNEGSLFAIKTKVFDSLKLKREQEVSIYLPDGYQHSVKKYPVIYVLDGTFLLSTAINTMQMRAKRDLMPESIVVGLTTNNNTTRFSIAMPTKRANDNKRVIFENGSPESFLAFMSEELMPFMRQNYRTATHNTLIGMSPTVGPLLVDYFNEQPLFEGYIALAADPDKFTVNGELISDKIVKTAEKNKTSKFYISRGGLDLMGRNEGLKNAFLKLQKDTQHHGIEKNVMVDIIDGGEHYSSGLEGINNGFKHIYPDSVWRPDYLTIREQDNPVEAFKLFYQQLNKNYGFTAYPVVDGYWMGFSMAGTARYLTRNKKYQQAIDLINWALIEQPNNITLHLYLASSLEDNNQLKQAITVATKMVKLAKQQNHRSQKYYEDYLARLVKAENG